MIPLRVLAVLAVCVCATGGFAQPATPAPSTAVTSEITTSPKVRLSAWYWLNSAPKVDWEGDFVTMKNLGFTDVLLCWGLDISAVATRKNETKEALRLAHKSGLGVYLLIWHPRANSLAPKDKYMQVTPDGKIGERFDTFNPEWRSTQWKAYLTDVVNTYKNEPALIGYAIDDAFGGSKLSYGEFEKKAFGEPLPVKPGDPRWDEWVSVRQGWWEDWAKDTMAFIRAADPNPDHLVYLEDTVNNILNKDRQLDKGLDFARVARHFDAVCGYTAASWTTATESHGKVLDVTRNAITKVREMIGPEKKMIYTFWSANLREERLPGPAQFPTAAQIKDVCEEARKLGITDLDMYGYRIGEYLGTVEDMKRMVPAEPAPYHLTKRFSQKFMWDRPEIHDELAEYLKSLNE